MRTFLIIIGLFLFIGNSFAQSYEELIEKSYDFVDKGDLVSAEESLKAAMRKEPANPLNYALLTNLGTIQRRQGKLQEALISYTSALSGHTKNITILENRASLYTELGETEKAFDKILEVNEKSVRARLGHAILEKMRGNYDESERIFNYLISEMPRDWILYEGRADLYFMMGKNARAMADIEKVFTESEPTANLYVLRGKIKLAQYEKERAALDFKKAESMGYNKEVIKELLKLTMNN